MAELWTVFTVLSVFGPYVVAGLRTEQLFVYGSSLVLVLAYGVRLIFPLTVMLAVWTLLIMVALTSSIAPAPLPPGMTPGHFLAGVDNFIMPVALTLLAGGIVAWHGRALPILRRTCETLVVAMLLNVAASFAQARGVRFHRWWGSADGSVAINAEGNLRYSGLVNQPAEAGLLYSIALLALFYRWPKRGGVTLLVGIVLSVGGLMTVSKIFILGGLPLALFYYVLQGDRLRRAAALVALVTGGYALRLFERLEEFSASTHLRLLLRSGEESLLSTVTAGRFGENSTLASVIREVSASAGVAGYGFGGLGVPYDNGWVEATVVAGGLGALAYTVVLGVLVTAWLRYPVAPERRFLGLLVVLTVLASLGLPALTANRAASLAWLLLHLLWLVAPERQDDSPEPSGVPVRGLARRPGALVHRYPASPRAAPRYSAGRERRRFET